jgi:hypothetical protein
MKFELAKLLEAAVLLGGRAQPRRLGIALSDLIANDQGTGHANLRRPCRTTPCNVGPTRRGTSDASGPCQLQRDFSIFSKRSRFASRHAGHFVLIHSGRFPER